MSLKINIVSKHDHAKSDNDFYCGRGSVFGNLYSTKQNSKARYLVSSTKEAIEKFEKYFYEVLLSDPIILEILDEMILKLKEYGYINLVCYCKSISTPNKKCHTEIIKKYLEKQL